MMECFNYRQNCLGNPIVFISSCCSQCSRKQCQEIFNIGTMKYVSRLEDENNTTACAFNLIILYKTKGNNTTSDYALSVLDLCR